MATEITVDLGDNLSTFPIRRGDTLRFIVTLWQELETPVDLTSATAEMEIVDISDDTDTETPLEIDSGLEVTDLESGEIHVKLTSEQTTAWSGTKRWSLRVTLINGDTYTICGGTFQFFDQLPRVQTFEDQRFLRSGSTIIVLASGAIDLEDIPNKLDFWVATNTDTNTRFKVFASEASAGRYEIGDFASTTDAATAYALKLPSGSYGVLRLSGTDLHPEPYVEVLTSTTGFTTLPSARLKVGLTYTKMTFVGTDAHPTYSLE